MTTALSNETTASAPELMVLEPLEHTGASVALTEVVRMAVANLLSNKVRSLLTMLGVIIGVASVVALMAIGTGATNSITSNLQANGTNHLTIQPGSPGQRGPGEAGVSQSLTTDDVAAIEALKLPINGISPQFGGSAQIVAPSADTNATITGVTADYKLVNNVTMASGTFLAAGQVRAEQPVVVLGSSLATTLFGSGQAVGETVRVQGRVLRVIGVMASKGGGGFGSVDDQALVPLGFAQKTLFGARTPDGNGWRVSNITLSAINSADLDSIQSRVTTLLRQRHQLKSDGSEDDFRFFNQTELLSSLTTTITLLTAFLASVAGISLLVGGIGIMNIMLVSVTERTREIGLRKAVGARPRDILAQFMVEALVISVAGGLIGLALGWGIAAIVTLTGLVSAQVSLLAVLLSVGFSMAVGLFFGIWPARRAAKLNPIDALRYE